MATINTSAVNNSIDNKSFALLRTNPKLTSNVKLLVNSVGDLFLSSFRANNELSKIEYQKYEVKSNGVYSIDIANFFKKIPLTQRYETLRNYSDITIFSEYEFQYEDQYHYGAIQNTTKIYDEQYKIFAPIWLEKQVPSKFVIYRIEDVDYKNEYTEDTTGQNSRILELLKNATIIKTFDLSKSSKIGEYLNNHINDKRFPSSALTINFKESSQSSFNGIDIVNGGFVSKSEQLDRDYIQVDNPEIFSNQTITNGFERNGIISANIVNLEFLFDDTTAENYKIYRYFGIYADDIDEGVFSSLELDSKGELNIDCNSYKTFLNLTGTSIQDIEIFPETQQFQIPTIQYVKDKSGVFYNIKDSSLKTIRNIIEAEPTVFNVTNSGSKGYIINGQSNWINRPITVIKEQTYIFNVQAVGHPFCIKTTPGVGFENQYNDGVTGNVTDINTIVFNVRNDAPPILYYNSGLHDSMSGTITVLERAEPRQNLLYKLLISTNNNSIDSFAGYAKNGKKITAELKEPSYKGFIKITVKGVPSTNDRIFIGDKTEIKISNNNLGDYLIIADSLIPPARAVDNKFSNQGSLQQIAIAIASAINNGEIVTYKTKVIDTSIIIEEIVAGNRRRQTAFGVYKNNLEDFIDINDAEFNKSGLIPSIEVDWNTWTTISGSIEGQSILVKSSEIGNLQVGEYLKQKDSNKFIKIIEINQDPFDNNYFRVVLNGVSKIANDKVFEVYEEYKTIHGKFAAYDFKDFDFDFYSTRNSDLGDLAYDFYKNPEYGKKNKLDEIIDTNASKHLSVDAPLFYSGLRDILSTETAETVVKNQLLNEYDRLKENNLKETALLSRVVPTICKYELKNSSNARNLPYILNVNEAFGDDNLSPNIESDSKRDVEFLNMEHFHLNRIPIETQNTKNNLNNYLDFASDGGLTLDKLKNIEFNFFESHFNWTGYLDNQVWNYNKSKKLYSKFDIGNFEKNSSAVFRGLRYIFQKRKEVTNPIPTEFLKGVDISDYKFGSYLSYNTSTDIIKNSVVFNCIKNDKFKFICINIELTVVKNDIEENELNRYLLYTLKDIHLSPGPEYDPYYNPRIIDTKIPFLIDFDGAEPTADKDTQFIINAAQISILAGDAKFTEFVKRDSTGSYSWIYFDYAKTTYALKILDVIDDTSIIVSGWPYKFDKKTGEADDNSRISDNNLSIVSPSGPFYYYRGGENEFANLLDSISAYKYAERLNSFGQVNYVTIAEDGTETENDFVLSVESGIDVVKPSIVISNDDPDRPKAFKIYSNKIGNIIEKREDGGYATILRRMNGDYNPLFNDIVTFSDIYSDRKILNGTDDLIFSNIIYNFYNGKGIAFDSFKENTDKYGVISNYFYHKVNEKDSKNVLKLSQTTDKLPLYPLIGEIAIDKKEINVFKSKYAKDYFTRSLSIGESFLTNGTLSPVEKKAFMTSTIMKVKDSYEITSYTNTKENSLEKLDKIRYTKSNISAIHWFEDDSQVIADFYLYSAILNELIEDGIKTHFKKYIKAVDSYGDKSSIDDDLQVYSKSNISNRFIIDSIKIYGIENKGVETEFVSITQASQLTDDNFQELTNFNIQSYQNDGLGFRLIYNKKLGYSNHFKILIKIQA
jgi:hypothetical protein